MKLNNYKNIDYVVRALRDFWTLRFHFLRAEPLIIKFPIIVKGPQAFTKDLTGETETVQFLFILYSFLFPMLVSG